MGNQAHGTVHQSIAVISYDALPVYDSQTDRSTHVAYTYIALYHS